MLLFRHKTLIFRKLNSKQGKQNARKPNLFVLNDHEELDNEYNPLIIIKTHTKSKISELIRKEKEK